MGQGRQAHHDRGPSQCRDAHLQSHALPRRTPADPRDGVRAELEPPDLPDAQQAVPRRQHDRHCRWAQRRRRVFLAQQGLRVRRLRRVRGGPGRAAAFDELRYVLEQRACHTGQRTRRQAERRRSRGLPQGPRRASRKDVRRGIHALRRCGQSAGRDRVREGSAHLGRLRGALRQPAEGEGGERGGRRPAPARATPRRHPQHEDESS